MIREKEKYGRMVNEMYTVMSLYLNFFVIIL